MAAVVVETDEHVDARADETIAECLTSTPPVSFFLFAGAGSGKTRSLVEALRVIQERVAGRFRLQGRRIGVITFTNKACDEIKRRVEYDELFAISTIHSFAWSLISGLNSDIREHLKSSLSSDIEEIQEKERKGRAGTKASWDRQAAIVAKEARLQSLDRIRRFIYNPNSDNPEENALNHAEVIKIASAFLLDKPMMQKILVTRFPILLVDESQDTDKLLMDALIHTQAAQSTAISLGIIGDTMQRIYTAGKMDIGSSLRDSWATPQKLMNHRSGRRIVELINRIRAPVDGQAQRCRADRGEGFVRLFIVPEDAEDKPTQERAVCHQMAEITGDEGWREPEHGVKTLILEHHMAARRLGFAPMWESLRRVSQLQTGLRDGSLPPLRFFSQIILPLIKAYHNGDRFKVASLVRRYSPLLEKREIEAWDSDQAGHIARAKEAVDIIGKLCCESKDPTFLDVVHCVRETGLFELPEAIRSFSRSDKNVATEAEIPEHDEEDEVAAWRSFLETPFSQIESYSQYIQGEAAYDTHQGIKGLEFPRVCVIMDDAEARGFMFSYEKLFGAKEDSSRTDPTRDSSMDRTRRLFYVTCSRAKDSLALIAYSAYPQRVQEHVLSEGWFLGEEVEILNL